MTRSSLVLVSLLALAQPGAVLAAEPCPRLDRGNLVACVLSGSPRLRAAELSIEAARGRLRAVSPLLPQNPVLSLSGAHRTNGTDQDGNWYITLAQEVELGGQRALRRRAAGGEVETERHEAQVVRRSLVAAAWEAYFRILALREEQELAARLEVATAGVARAARGMSDRGLISPVDADVAAASALRLARRRIEVGLQLRRAQAALALLVGREPGHPLLVEGALEPLATQVEQDRSRPELLARRAERQALEARLAILRRQRVPNLTVSAFVQRDGFGERVLGLGLSLPVPLPDPLGRTYAGEIGEARAVAGRAGAQVQQLEGEYALARAGARAEYEARQAEVALFQPDSLKRAGEALEKIAANVTAGRLAVREGIVSQLALVELLQSHVEVRLSLCLASVRLREAQAAPLEITR